MSIRSALPQPVRRLARTAYVAMSSITAGRRVLPDFLLVGGQRCGTTSLFRALEQSPMIVRPTVNKGINYFDVNYAKGERWYRAHFPTAKALHASHGDSYAVFEASGYYMFHPLAPERIVRDLPEIKIVAMLRDPFERAFSEWKHESARGFEDLPFEEALRLEESRTLGELERMVADPNYQSFTYRHHSYGARGDYVPQLTKFLDRIPSERLHVIYSEDFFTSPEQEFSRLVEFLEVPESTGISFEKHNARPSGPMPEVARELLSERYAGQSDELERIVGRRPPWGAAAGRS